jgi:hypothetical protein
LGEAQRLQEIVEQDFAGMHRRQFLGFHGVNGSR